MSFEDLHAQGERTFASLVPGGEERLAQIFRVAPDLAETVVGTVYGHLHHRPALDPRTREAVALSAILATGMYGTSLAVHLRTGMASGLASAEIVEILLETAAFAGIPRAVSALPQVEESLAAAGRPVPPGPSPRQVVLEACAEIRGDGGGEAEHHGGDAEPGAESGAGVDPDPGAAAGAGADAGVDPGHGPERGPEPGDGPGREPGAGAGAGPDDGPGAGDDVDADADADAECQPHADQEPAWRRSLRGLLVDCPRPWIQTLASDRALAVFGPTGARAGQEGPTAVMHFRLSGTDVVSAVVFTPPAVAPVAPDDAPSVSSSSAVAFEGPSEGPPEGPSEGSSDGAPDTASGEGSSADDSSAAPASAGTPVSPPSSISSRSSEATVSWSPGSPDAPSGPATLGRVLDYLRSTHPVPAETTHGDTRSVPDPDVLEDLEPVRFLLAQGARPVIREVDASHVTAAIPTGNGDTAVVLARLDDGAVTRVTVLHPGG